MFFSCILADQEKDKVELQLFQLHIQNNDVPTKSLPSEALPESLMAGYDLYFDALSCENMPNIDLPNIDLPINEMRSNELLQDINPTIDTMTKVIEEKIASFTDGKIINSKKQIMFKINMNYLSDKIFTNGLKSENLFLKVIVLDDDVKHSNLDFELDERLFLRRIKVKKHQNNR